MMYQLVAERICAETACPPAVVFNDFSGSPTTTGRVLPPIVKAAIEQALRGEVTYVHPEAWRAVWRCCSARSESVEQTW
jgi:hypothetical protein